MQLNECLVIYMATNNHAVHIRIILETEERQFAIMFHVSRTIKEFRAGLLLPHILTTVRVKF